MLLLGPLASLLLLVGVSSGPGPQDGHAPLEVPQQAVNDPVLSRGKRGIVDDLNRRETSTCIIRNDRFNEHLHASNVLFLGRICYLWTPGSEEGGSQWSIVKESGGSRFYIRNINFSNEYLTGAYNYLRTRPSPDSKYLWEIEPFDTENHSNKVKLSLGNNTYLGAYKNTFVGVQQRSVGLSTLEDWALRKDHDNGNLPEVWVIVCS